MATSQGGKFWNQNSSRPEEGWVPPSYSLSKMCYMSSTHITKSSYWTSERNAEELEDGYA